MVKILVQNGAHINAQSQVLKDENVEEVNFFAVSTTIGSTSFHNVPSMFILSVTG